MHLATKVKLLWSVASACGVAALVLAVLAFLLIKAGAYPPPGTSSLGHVGIVVAGIVAAFLAIFCAGLILVCASKVRELKNAANGSQRDERAHRSN